MEQATFAAGPFWEAEDAFRHLEGVVATRVGYTGGATAHPSHEEVAAGGSGHAEAVEVTFDPGRVAYDALLEVFWGTHDPAAPDAGSGPHCSAIFTHSAAQEVAARESLARLAAARPGGPQPLTRILPAPAFYPAEEHHQHYYEKRFG